jgi:hypothetical protein
MRALRGFLMWLIATGLPMQGLAQNAPVIVSPASGSTTYDTQPWIYFTVSNSGIDDFSFWVYNNGTCSAPIEYSNNLVNYRTIACPSSTPPGTGFSCHPWPASSGDYIRIRVPVTLGTGASSVSIIVSASGGVYWSPYSTCIPFTIASPGWTYSAAAGTTIHVADFNQLRTAVQNARGVYANMGLGTYTWTDTTLTGGSSLIRYVDLENLRQALTPAYADATGSNPTYTAPDPMTSGTTIRSIHITELRADVLYP